MDSQIFKSGWETHETASVPPDTRCLEVGGWYYFAMENYDDTWVLAVWESGNDDGTWFQVGKWRGSAYEWDEICELARDDYHTVRSPHPWMKNEC